VIEAYATQLDVLVRRVVSRGQGVLEADPAVEITFLVDQADFVSLRQRLLRRTGDVRFTVSLGDVTAIDTTHEHPSRLWQSATG